MIRSLPAAFLEVFDHKPGKIKQLQQGIRKAITSYAVPFHPTVPTQPCLSYLPKII